MSGADLPQGWVETTIGEVGRVRVGRQRSPERHTGKFSTPYLRAANITPTGIDVADLQEMDFTPDERSVYALRDGDVVLTEASGSEAQVGRSAIWRDELPLCCFQNTVIRFRPHVVVPEYALLVFRHHMATGVFASTARGMGIQHLGASRFAELSFPLPPLAEQRRIADEANRRITELNGASASLEKALTRTHEQDSEILAAAVGGSLEKALPVNEPDLGPLEDEASAPVPTGWKFPQVDEVGEVRLGKQRAPASHTGPNMRPYLRVANVFEDRIDLSDVKEMNFTPDESETYELQDGDILLNEGQSLELVGRSALYRGELPGACFQNTLLRFRASAEVEPEFALLVFRHYLHHGEFRRLSRGSTNIAHLSRTRFAAMPFPLPPIEEQRAIVRKARQLLNESQARREMIVRSLQQIDAVAEEILVSAVSGDLVPQEASDEPAESLLARGGEPPPDKVDIDANAREGRDVAERQPSARHEQDEPLLAATLRGSGSMTIPELCRAAGFDLNEIGEIERFYLALRQEIGTSIEATGKPAENQAMRAIPDAS
jgi:restriction endonuclease S subunit